MAKKSRRAYGSGCVIEVSSGLAIRWREIEITPEGKRKKVLRYETLGDVSRRQANRVLNGKLSQEPKVVELSITFLQLANLWKSSIVPTYKHSTRKSHLEIMEKKLQPRFGEMELKKIGKQDIQLFIGELIKAGYSPNTIDHIHNVLSTVLSKGVTWGYLEKNAASGVEMPKLKPKRQKWVLTVEQARTLLSKLDLLAKTIVGIALLTGMRRGELFALQWKNVDSADVLDVRQAVYDGVFDTPKTPASERKIPLCLAAVELLMEWKEHAKKRDAEDLIFSTRTGKPVSPNNVLRRQVFPACKELGLPNATWLTFRRTCSSWCHANGIPDKVTAELLGHSSVYTTLNVYTQVMDGSRRAAAEKIGSQLFSNCSVAEKSVELIH